MLRLIGITKRTGSVDLFKEVHLSVAPHQRVGIIGPPGSGKSSLLRIILGLEDYQEGKVQIRPFTSFGYLPPEKNEPLFPCEYTIGNVFRTALESAEWRNSAPQKTGVKQEIEKPVPNLEGLMAGLQMRHLLPSQKLNDLSPEEQRLIFLVSLLIAQPDVLVLDEPANYLGTAACEWLDELLADYPGTLLMACKSGTLPQPSLSTTWQIIPDLCTIQEIPGNYRQDSANQQKVS